MRNTEWFGTTPLAVGLDTGDEQVDLWTIALAGDSHLVADPTAVGGGGTPGGRARDEVLRCQRGEQHDCERVRTQQHDQRERLHARPAERDSGRRRTTLYLTSGGNTPSSRAAIPRRRSATKATRFVADDDSTMRTTMVTNNRGRNAATPDQNCSGWLTSAAVRRDDDSDGEDKVTRQFR